MSSIASRPIRVEYPNACYHVINRGNRRERVFTCDSDYELFIEKLAEYAELYEVELQSYCLMPNHFHLQLRTKHANLGKFMQSCLTSFTLTMNRKYGKSGHLFQGRYKSQLVESEEYKNKLSRYIHLNPVKVQAMEEVPFDKKKLTLRDFRWSSFRAYIGLENKPEWLNRNHVLSSWGKMAKEKMSNYRKYVEEGIVTNNAEDIQAVMQGIIGSDSFKDKIVKTFLVRDVSDIDGREQSLLLKINALSVDDVIDIVMKEFSLKSAEEIIVRRGGNLIARKIAMYLSVKYCRRNETLTSIADKFGVKISALNMAKGKIVEQLKKDNQLKILISKIENENVKL